jgi:hypothetical protein
MTAADCSIRLARLSSELVEEGESWQAVYFWRMSRHSWILDMGKGKSCRRSRRKSERVAYPSVEGRMAVKTETPAVAQLA